jgi:hypothetical protein
LYVRKHCQVFPRIYVRERIGWWFKRGGTLDPAYSAEDVLSGKSVSFAHIALTAVCASCSITRCVRSSLCRSFRDTAALQEGFGERVSRRLETMVPGERHRIIDSRDAHWSSRFSPIVQTQRCDPPFCRKPSRSLPGPRVSRHTTRVHPPPARHPLACAERAGPVCCSRPARRSRAFCSATRERWQGKDDPMKDETADAECSACGVTAEPMEGCAHMGPSGLAGHGGLGGWALWWGFCAVSRRCGPCGVWWQRAGGSSLRRMSEMKPCPRGSRKKAGHRWLRCVSGSARWWLTNSQGLSAAPPARGSVRSRGRGRRGQASGSGHGACHNGGPADLTGHTGGPLCCPTAPAVSGGRSEPGSAWISRVTDRPPLVVVHTADEAGETCDRPVWLGATITRRSQLVGQVPCWQGGLRRQDVTTRCDPRRLPRAEIARRDARRWESEVAFVTLTRERG